MKNRDKTGQETLRKAARIIRNEQNRKRIQSGSGSNTEPYRLASSVKKEAPVPNSY